VEKFYNSEEWMSYLIDMFLKPGNLPTPTRVRRAKSLPRPG
jgi:hypothetical protein